MNKNVKIEFFEKKTKSYDLMLYSLKLEIFKIKVRDIWDLA